MPTELELLQKIAANTASDSSLRVAMIAGGSAVAGALASAILSYFGIRHTVRAQAQIEKQRLLATVITTERLRWLQDIRARLANVYAKMDTQFSLTKRPIQLPETIVDRQKTLDDSSSVVMTEVHVIHLMLNPKKVTQLTVRQSLSDCQKIILNCVNDRQLANSDECATKYADTKKKAFDALTVIGVDTWEKIKELQ
jgi:hypothetical protein